MLLNGCVEGDASNVYAIERLSPEIHVVRDVETVSVADRLCCWPRMVQSSEALFLLR